MDISFDPQYAANGTALATPTTLTEDPDMANPVIRSFNLSATTVAPGGSVIGVVDAYDPDNRTVRVEANVGAATAVTLLTVADTPLPTPVFTEVDAAGNPVTTPTVDFVADTLDPTRVTITARVL